MKKIFLSFLFSALTGLALLAQKTVNDSNAEKRSVGSFHGIDVGTGIELSLSAGSSEEVAVSANTSEHRDKIITKVENGILKIHYETKTGAINKKNETKNLKAYVSFKTLDKLYASTGAEVEITGVIQASTLDIKANTGAEINGKVDAGTLTLDQNTGSKVNLSGKAERLEVEGSTGSRFAGEGLSTGTCDVKVSTGARVAVNVEKELQVKASTGGIVKYKGNAGIREIRTGTGGTVSKI
ncbi:MAG TPA: head GIN domain-containing protein [Chitinophagaceae bacterium]|nr:head GIN domain-containing protein [Chitinophagaceae bacterium]